MNSTTNNALNQRGFTLIELMIVLSIITICFAIVIPQFYSVSDKIELEFLAKQICADLYWAQNQAIASGITMNVQFPHNSSFYLLRQGLALVKTKSYAEKYDITTTSNYASQTISFNNKGSVNGGEIFVTSKSGKIVKLVIQVVSGRVRIETV